MGQYFHIELEMVAVKRYLDLKIQLVYRNLLAVGSINLRGRVWNTLGSTELLQIYYINVGSFQEAFHRLVHINLLDLLFWFIFLANFLLMMKVLCALILLCFRQPKTTQSH